VNLRLDRFFEVLNVDGDYDVDIILIFDDDYDNDYVDVGIMLMFDDDYYVDIILMFDDDYDGDFDNGELLATNSYMQLATTLMVCACIEKCCC
jgi:hypothetical protein